jgi:hypothetical protein
MDGERLRDKVDGLLVSLEDKAQMTKAKQERLNVHKQAIIDKIDQFFDKVVERVQLRREALKEEYRLIESRQRRRLKSKQMKLERDLKELKSFSTELFEFISEFDNEMDIMANKAALDGYLADLQIMEADIKKGVNFFKVSSFREPTFNFLNHELELIDQMGKVTDTSDFSMPLVAFNTYHLEIYNYIEK